VNGFSVTRLISLVVLALLGLGFLTLAPSSLGGTATWVVTEGASMEPAIRTGDLVIARPEPSLRVGDVVAYPSQTLEGTVVLHRIVAATTDGFITRGDNNDWLDPDQPQSSEMLGKMWLHIPGGGRVLTLFTDPLFIGAFVIVLLTAGSLFTDHRTRRRRPRRPTASNPGKAFLWVTALPVRELAVVAALASIALAVVAFGRPTVSTAQKQIDVEHTGQLSYSAPVDTPGVYSGDQIRTGDPVFLPVASAINTHLDYDLAFDSGKVTGTIASTARVSASNGWSRDVPLGTEGTLRAIHVERTVPLDFTALLKLVHTAERQAGTSFGSYTVELVHNIDAQGTVAGQQVTTSSTPALTFALSDQQAVLQGDDALGTPGTPVDVAAANNVAIAGTAPAMLSVLQWEVPAIATLFAAATSTGVPGVPRASSP